MMTEQHTSVPGLLAVVALREPYPELGLPIGAVGTVVEQLDAGHVEVEFSDLDGVGYAQAALPASALLRLDYGTNRAAA